MSVMLRTKTNDYDLGGTMEFLACQQELALMAERDKKDFPHVFGIIDTNEEEVDADWIKACAAEAKEALELYGPKFSDHAKWVLGELARLGKAKT